MLGGGNLVAMDLDPGLAPIEEEESMERGLAYSDLGKSSSFSDLGSVQLVNKENFLL